jgi:hypothetical protein
MMRLPRRPLAFVLLLALLGATPVGFACSHKKSRAAEDPARRDLSTPRTLPDVPLYPSGKVVEKAYAADGSFQIRLLTAASSEDIISFYERRLKPLGWERISDVKENEYLAIYRKGDKQLLVSILPTDSPDEVLHVLNYKEL